MSRIQLDLPVVVHYSYQTRVRIADINYGNHLGHDSLISILHDARLHFLKDRGVDELNFLDRGLILSDIAVQYKSESFHSDVLQVNMEVSDWNKYGFKIKYLVFNPEKNIEVARAQTSMLFFDYGVRKLSPVPEGAQRLLES